MAELVYDTKTERYESARVEGLPFDKALALLANNNLSLISGELNAQLRIALGPHAPLSQTGNYITQGILRASRKDVYLPQASPVLANAAQATQAHREGKPFLLSKQGLEEAREGATRVTRFSIPFNELGDDPAGQHIFGAAAGPYGAFLQTHLSPRGITTLNIFPPNDTREANQLWLSGLVSWSRLDGGNRGLAFDYGVRGVRR